MDVELWHAQGVGVDLVVVGHARLQIMHQGDVRAGAPHVERDDFANVCGGRHVHRAIDASDRAGQEGAGAASGGLLERHRAAVRAHDVDRRHHAALLHHARQLVEIGGHHRRQIGVENRGRGAFELAALGNERCRLRYRNAAELRSQSIGRSTLVRCVAIAVDESHRHGLDALSA